MTEQATAPEEQGAPEAQAEVPAETQNENTENPSSEAGLSLDDALGKTFDEVTAPDEPKDAPKEEEVSTDPEKEADEKEASEAEQDDKQEEANEPETPAIDPPVSWSKEMKEQFGNLPPETQTYIVQRESDSQAAISRLSNEVHKGKPLADVIDRHLETFKRNSIEPVQGVEQLLNAQSILDSNPKEGIRQIAQAYGVDLEEFAFEESEDNAPQITALQNEVNQLKNLLAQQETQRQQVAQSEAQRAQQEMMLVVDKFAAENPHFATLENQIYHNIPAIKDADPGLSEGEILSRAYEMALWQNEETRAELLTQREKKALEAAADKASKAKAAASLNVTSNQVLDNSTTNLDDALGGVWAKHSN
jgi:hypothetical protein